MAQVQLILREDVRRLAYQDDFAFLLKLQLPHE